MYPSIITREGITVLFPSGPKYITNENPNFNEVRKLIAAGDTTNLESLFSIARSLSKWSNERFNITDDGVFEGKERLPALIEERVLTFWSEGLPFEPLLAFYGRLKANPSNRAVEELYRFLEHKNLPIGEDGCFYAYKSVRHNWTDHHTGQFLNTVGATHEMRRNLVNDNANIGCSHGFHVGSLQYASTFGGGNSRLLICKVDPADVVSVPHDCECQKVRTCKYTVVAEYTGPLPEGIYSASTTTIPDDEVEWEASDNEEGCHNCGYPIDWEYDNYCKECGRAVLH